MQQARCRDAVDIGKAAIRIGLKIEASHEIEQAAIGAVGDRHRQRRLVVGLDVAADQTAQQGAQSLLRRLAGAQEIELLLEVFEGSAGRGVAAKARNAGRSCQPLRVEEATGLYSPRGKRAMAVPAFPPCPS